MRGGTYEQEISRVLIDDYRLFLRTGIPLIENLLYTALYEFNLWNSLALYKKGRDYIEGFYFVSTRENNNIINVYVNKLDVLQRYTHYFIEKLPAATNRGEMEQMTTPLISPFTLDSPCNNMQKEIFSLELPPFFLTINNNPVKLRRREFECLQLIAHGKTFKCVARTLDLSPKTVEFYLSNLKKKTGIADTAALIDLYWDNSYQ